MKNLTLRRAVSAALRLGAISVAVGLLAPIPAHASISAQWIGEESGDWTNGNNWETFSAPQSGAEVRVTDEVLSGVKATTVTYSDTASDTLHSLLVDGTSTPMTLEQSTDPLSTDTFTVGDTGTGNYNLGGGGTLEVVNVNTIDGVSGHWTVGGSSGGVGSVVQTGGDASADVLNIGANGGASGSYDLQDGSLTVFGTTLVGDAGTGAFTQGGGTHTTGDLILGNQPGGSGSYTLDNGTVTVNGNLGVGASDAGDGMIYAGKGTFTQNGGLVDVQGGFYQDGGYNGEQSHYALNGGTLNSASFGSMSHDSVFDHTGGTHNNSGLFIVGNGGGSDFATVYNMTGAAAESNFQDLWVGGFGVGKLNQSDGTVNVGGELRVGDGPNIDPTRRYGEYNLSGGTVKAENDVVVGVGNNDAPDEPGGKGTFTQSGGEHTVAGTLRIGQGGNIGGGTGVYTLSGDPDTVKLTTGETRVGGAGSAAGTGVFDQQGGTHTTSGLYLGSGGGDGTYTLAGGALNAGIAYVGEGGNGHFTQTSGSFTTDFLNNGTIGGGSGQYDISGGTLTVDGNLTAGGSDATGVYNQTGGDVTVNTAMFIGGVAPGSGSGTYNLSAADGPASLTVQGDAVIGDLGKGTVNQTGGTFTANELRLGNSSNGDGTYNLSDGDLKVTNNIAVGGASGSTGIFNQDGGSLVAAGMNVSSGGTFNYSDGTYSLGGGTGTLTNSGQVNITGAGLTVDANVANSGDFDVRAGASVTGTGDFTQTGGTLTVNGTLTQTSLDLLGGTLQGAGTINGDVIVDGALVAPGNSPGILHVVGDFSLDSGILKIEIGGINPDQYDVLDITGLASFTDSTIEFDFIDGFLPTTGQTWAFLLTGGITLTGVNFTYTGLAPGFDFSVDSINGTQLRLTANNDGQPVGGSVPEPGSLLLMLAGSLGFMPRLRAWGAVRRA